MALMIPDLYDFLRGPGFAISILVFISGFIYRTLMLIRATRKIQKNGIAAENFISAAKAPVDAGLFEKLIPVLHIKIKNTIFGTNPVMGTTSFLFHILLFAIPAFLSAHNVIADLTVRFSLPSLPEPLADKLAIIIMALVVFFLVRRISIPRVRMISSSRDYLILILVMAPFLSGFLAYHHFFNYRVVIFIHMIIGELAIMALPFTGLIHMPFIIFSRFFIDSEYSITPGNRSW